MGRQVQQARDVSESKPRRSSRHRLSLREKISRHIHSGLAPLVVIILTSLVFLSVLRAVFTAWQWDQVPEGSLSTIFLQGLRIDFASVCGLFGVPLLLLAVASLLPTKFIVRLLIAFFKVYCTLAIGFLAWNEFASFGFIEEYGVRPNHLYVQYLLYPKEVLSVLWGGHKLGLFFTVVATLIVAVAAWFITVWAFKRYRKRGFIYNFVAVLLILCIVPLGIRSTLGHRPLNPSMVSFSNNAMANSLPLNSSYSVVYALAHLNDTSLDEDAVYQIAYDADVIAQGKALSAHTPANRYADRCPFNQQILPQIGMYDGSQGSEVRSADSVVDHKPYNVVIILEESLGDNFVASQGGFPVTPNLEALREHGWWFNNMYASGHRSIRGIEAVTAAFPASPLHSIVKLPAPMRPYATVFKIFQEAGYQTSFIYGGESHFDNMRSFFLENGMHSVVEEKDYSNPSFVSSWGVSDEDLFARAHEEFKKLHAAGQPFCSVVFSSSFHDPFEIPEGKVELDFETQDPTRLLAAKYADYALGKYFEQARAEGGYYDNTIFVVIADHESRVRGTGVFPLHDFTIPAVIVAPNVQAHEDNRQVSQIDIAMTVLSLAGIEGEVPNVGQDLTRADTKDRALMQFNDMFGYLKQDKFISLAPHCTPYMYKVTAGEKLELMSDVDAGMLKEAIELSNLGPLLYHGEYMSSRCIKLETKVTAPTECAEDTSAPQVAE